MMERAASPYLDEFLHSGYHMHICERNGEGRGSKMSPMKESKKGDMSTGSNQIGRQGRESSKKPV